MTKQIIRHIDGQVLYECVAETFREAVERAVGEEVSLEGANLVDVNLRGADLRGAYLRDADLGGTDLRNAYLMRANLIDAGQDSRGYRFVGVPTDGLRIAAGCRWFTLNEAQEHWANSPDALARVELIAAEARRRGWIATNSAQPPASEGGRATAAHHDNADGPCCCGAWHVNESTPDHRNILIF